MQLCNHALLVEHMHARMHCSRRTRACMYTVKIFRKSSFQVGMENIYGSDKDENMQKQGKVEIIRNESVDTFWRSIPVLEMKFCMLKFSVVFGGMHVTDFRVYIEFNPYGSCYSSPNTLAADIRKLAFSVKLNKQP